jgi:hypothetical protein
MHLDLFANSLGTANGWLGYWGGYFGALIGAITVYLVTNKQLKTQRIFHEQTLNNQLDLHYSNLEHQRELQVESINKAAMVNDQRERDLEIAKIRLQKLDIIVQNIIELNGLNNERFNHLREFSQRAAYTNELRNRISRMEGEDRAEMRKAIINRERKIDEVLEKETVVRNKIMIISAKIKSDSMYVDFDDQISPFREYQTNILDKFQELAQSYKDTPEEFMASDFNAVLEIKNTEFFNRVNKILGSCKLMLDQEMRRFKRGT